MEELVLTGKEQLRSLPLSYCFFLYPFSLSLSLSIRLRLCLSSFGGYVMFLSYEIKPSHLRKKNICDTRKSIAWCLFFQAVISRSTMFTLMRLHEHVLLCPSVDVAVISCVGPSSKKLRKHSHSLGTPFTKHKL